MSKRKPSPTPTPAPTNVLNGTSGNDTLLWAVATAGTVDGGAGFDTLTVSLGSLTTDLIMTGAIGSGQTAQFSTGLTVRNVERMVVNSGGGNDRLFGGGGDDHFATFAGNDSVSAGAGNDFLDLGWGRNVATGGSGADTFFLIHDGHTTITDFSVADGDKLFLDLFILDITTGWGLANGFLRFTDSAAGAVIEVDFDGSGGAFGWTEVALLQGVQVAALTPDSFTA